MVARYQRNKYEGICFYTSPNKETQGRGHCSHSFSGQSQHFSVLHRDTQGQQTTAKLCLQIFRELRFRYQKTMRIGCLASFDEFLLAGGQCMRLLTCDVIAQNLDSKASRFIWTPMATERERESERVKETESTFQ